MSAWEDFVCLAFVPLFILFVTGQMVFPDPVLLEEPPHMVYKQSSLSRWFYLLIRYIGAFQNSWGEKFYGWPWLCYFFSACLRLHGSSSLPAWPGCWVPWTFGIWQNLIDCNSNMPGRAELPNMKEGARKDVKELYKSGTFWVLSRNGRPFPCSHCIPFTHAWFPWA